MDAFGKPIDYFGKPVDDGGTGVWDGSDVNGPSINLSGAPVVMTPWNSQAGAFNDGSFRSSESIHWDAALRIKRTIDTNLLGDRGLAGFDSAFIVTDGNNPPFNATNLGITPFSVDFGEFILTGPTFEYNGDVEEFQNWANRFGVIKIHKGTWHHEVMWVDFTEGGPVVGAEITGVICNVHIGGCLFLMTRFSGSGAELVEEPVAYFLSAFDGTLRVHENYLPYGSADIGFAFPLTRNRFAVTTNIAATGVGGEGGDEHAGFIVETFRVIQGNLIRDSYGTEDDPQPLVFPVNINVYSAPFARPDYSISVLPEHGVIYIRGGDLDTGVVGAVAIAFSQPELSSTAAPSFELLWQVSIDLMGDWAMSLPCVIDPVAGEVRFAAWGPLDGDLMILALGVESTPVVDPVSFIPTVDPTTPASGFAQVSVSGVPFTGQIILASDGDVVHLVEFDGGRFRVQITGSTGVVTEVDEGYAPYFPDLGSRYLRDDSGGVFLFSQGDSGGILTRVSRTGDAVVAELPHLLNVMTFPAIIDGELVYALGGPPPWDEGGTIVFFLESFTPEPEPPASLTLTGAVAGLIFGSSAT